MTGVNAVLAKVTWRKKDSDYADIDYWLLG